LIDTYAETSQTRNQKVVEYTGIQVQLQALNAEIDGRTQEVRQLQSELAGSSDPGLPKFVIFLAKLLSDAKQSLVRALCQEHRAYEYWAVAYIPFEVPSYDLNVLYEVHSKLQSDALQERINRNLAPQAFGPIRLAISKQTHPAEFASFAKSNSITFSIPLDEPVFQLGFTELSLSTLKLLVKGIKSPNRNVSVHVTHHGRSTFQDRSRNSIVFSHAHKDAQIAYSFDSGPISHDDGNLAQDGFAGISPFATWTIAIRKEDNNNQTLDLSHVSEIDLTFYGTYVPAI